MDKKMIIAVFSFLALALLIAAPILYFLEKVDLPASKNLMLLATIAWFLSAPLWMGRSKA